MEKELRREIEKIVNGWYFGKGADKSIVMVTCCAIEVAEFVLKKKHKGNKHYLKD
tara:strand:+ start:52 stop:216 length:165 start_codon:yes stop_codon:yes gene_type:complete